MSIVEEKSASRISSKASDLLDCFVAGLDGFVYQIAEHMARHRVGKMDPAEPVDVDTEDVIAAGKTVIGLLREQLRRGELSADVGPEIDQIERCFSSRQTVG
jgi:hypothetical protein